MSPNRDEWMEVFKSVVAINCSLTSATISQRV